METATASAAERPPSRRLFGLGRGHRDGTPATGGTLHAWAVAVCTEPHQSCWAWLSCGMSLGLVWAQIVALYIVINETAHPSCYSHADCLPGLFCEQSTESSKGSGLGLGFSRVKHLLPRSASRCMDCRKTCFWVKEHSCRNSSSGLNVQCDLSNIDTLSPTCPSPQEKLGTAQLCDELLGSVSIGGHTFAPWVDEPQSAARLGSGSNTRIPLKGNQLRPWDTLDQTKNHVHIAGADATTMGDCLALFHCEETDIFPGRCDHVQITVASYLQPRRVTASRAPGRSRGLSREWVSAGTSRSS